MTWLCTEERIVPTNISGTDLGVTSPASGTITTTHPLGTIVRARDGTFGGGEFIYLQGCVGTVVGMMVWYNPLTGVTTLTPNTANMNRPVAVAMSVCNLTTLYGWYQIEGAATILKTAVAVVPDSAIWQSATIGRFFVTATTGKQIVNARTVSAATVASGTSSVVVLINRPHMQGQII